MRTMAKAALVLLALGLFIVPAQAQMLEGQALGDAYLSFDPGSYVETKTVAAFVPFNWYLVLEIDYTDIGLPEATNAGNGVKGWEFGVSVPADIVVQGRVLNPEGSLNLGGPDDWIVGTASSTWGIATNSPLLVVNYTGLLLEEGLTNLEIAYKDVSVSSFDPPVAGWVELQSTDECFRGTPPNETYQACLRAFATVRGAILNPDVAVEENSWGSVKSRF